jgi:hypothetical protein
MFQPCQGCKDRREKMVGAATAMIEWIKNPKGPPPLDAMIKNRSTVGQPAAPTPTQRPLTKPE